MKELEGLFLISCVLLMFGCKKNIKPEYPYENGCERFAGEYIMYDPINEISYVMTCDCIPKENQLDNDTLIFENFANLFSFKRSGDYYLNEPGRLANFAKNPLTDRNGFTWSFSMGGVSSEGDMRNEIIGDSIYIVFGYDNSLYYLEDDTSYQNCSDCLHYGVKVH